MTLVTSKVSSRGSSSIPALNTSDNSSPSSELTIHAETTPVVVRPTVPSRASSKNSSLRLSFNPGEIPPTSQDSNTPSEVFTPKKSNLSRRAIEKNALRKSLVPPSTSLLPIRPPDDRPSYTTSALSELRNSTPSTPKDLHSLSDTEHDPPRALDVASKFGSDLALYATASSIPTETQIREKKDRRARLAKEQDFISLSPSSSSNNNTTISLLPSKQKPESRLAHDDENLLEDFDSFVSDGQIALGRQAEKAQHRRHQLELRELIRTAEGASSATSSSDSETEQHASYEASQTRSALDGLAKPAPPRSRRPKTPPRITPLPQLSACVERLQSTLRRMEESRAGKVRQLEGVEREKVEIGVREEEIRKALREAGEAYERLSGEAATAKGVGEDASATARPRGLETLGLTVTGTGVAVSGGEG